MAVHRRPAQPPPAASSSEETDSGSSDDESEEETTRSPPPAAANGMTTPPPQMAAADDEEEDESDEEEEEPESSDEEESEEEEEGDEREEEEKEKVEEEEEEGEEEEEEEGEESDDEMLDAELALAKGVAQDKKPAAPFQRIWSVADEVRILEALAAHRREHGTLPQPDALSATVASSLDHSFRGPADLQVKVNRMRRRYVTLARKGTLPSKEQDRQLFDLSKAVWGTDVDDDQPGNNGAQMQLGELCRLLPFFADEVQSLQREQPGLFKSDLMVDEQKARAMDARIRKQRDHEMMLELRRHDLVKVVTKKLMHLSKKL